MRKQKKRNRKPILILFLLLTVIICLAVIVTLRKEYMPAAQQSAQKTVAVPSGASTSEIADTLKENEIIHYPSFFIACSKLQKNDGQYKEGTYQLSASMGYEKIMKTLKGELKNEASIKVTIPEGFEFRQIVDRLENAGLIKRETFIQEAEHGTFHYSFLENLPNRENRLEGYLFPDTYLFHEGESEHDIIDTMLKRFDEIYTQQYASQAKSLNLTTDQVIILASIIEREAVDDSDRKNVSSVFHNRLKSSDMPYLQSCATVQYVLKERKAVLSEKDTRIQSPYNTYINKGLPIGPIASPGKASIEAALYPNQTDYLFFVLGKEGKHIYSKTYADHLKAQQS